MKIFVDIGFDAFDRLARRLQPLVDDGGLHLDEFDAGVVGTRRSAELFEIVGVAGVRGDVVHQEHSLGAVNLGVGRFAEDLRVRRVDLAVEYTLVVELLRLVTQEHNDLAFHVQARVVVVIVLGGGDAETREYDVSGNFAGAGKIQRDKVIADTKRLRFLSGGGDAVAVAEARGGGDVEILEVAIARQRL